MSLINSDFPQDSEDRSFLHWLGGIGRAVIGNSRKFLQARQWTRINQKVLLMDFSYGNLMAIAQNTPHLNVIITKGAEMFSNMKIKHVDKDGQDIEGSDILKLLSKPNPLQTMDGWLYQFYVYNAIYNNAFGYKNYARRKEFRGGDLPSFLWWLPSGEMKINLTGMIYRQTKIEDIIIGYTLFLDPTMFTPDEIIFITEGIAANGISCGTKLEALQIPLSNINAALKSKNIIIAERGLMGIISSGGGSTDSQGALPFDKKERERAEKMYQRNTSLDQEGSHVTFSNANLKWIPMAFDVKQLQLSEGLEDDFAVLCGAFGLDRDIFPSVKGATFENKEQGLKFTYQNTIQPLADKLMLHLENHFGLTDAGKGEHLIADYSWMPLMKEDEEKAEQARNQRAQACSTMLADGVISHEQYAEIMDVEFDGTGEIVQPPAPVLGKPATKPKKPNQAKLPNS